MQATISIVKIDAKDTDDWLKRGHYAKRICPRSYCFAAVRREIVWGIVTYGIPANYRMGESLIGKEYSDRVLELNRLSVRSGAPKNTASMLVGRSLQMLPKLCVVSFADTSMGHIGYIYQATNWIYTGLSHKRKDRVFKDGRKLHNRHMYDKNIIKEDTMLVDRPRKHRYVFFTDKNLRKHLRYEPMPYPKGDTKRHKVDDISASISQTS